MLIEGAAELFLIPALIESVHKVKLDVRPPPPCCGNDGAPSYIFSLMPADTRYQFTG